MLWIGHEIREQTAKSRFPADGICSGVATFVEEIGINESRRVIIGSPDDGAKERLVPVHPSLRSGQSLVGRDPQRVGRFNSAGHGSRIT
jgi:hypothetical protein